LNVIHIIYFQSDVDIQKLVTKSIEARKYAYCPYSSFAVGAALRSTSGEIFLGKSHNFLNFLFHFII
jgi:cytidine deaminase